MRGSLAKEKRKKEADDRQKVYDDLSPAEKLKKLDALFGPGLGAAKERKKLQEQKS